MKKSLALLMVVALVSITAGAWAGTGKCKDLAPVVSGTVASVTVDNGVLKSFVISHVDQNVTITVTTDTVYKLGKQAGTADDVKVGAKVLVRLTEAVKDNAGTAKIVRIRVAK